MNKGYYHSQETIHALALCQTLVATKWLFSLYINHDIRSVKQKLKAKFAHPALRLFSILGGYYIKVHPGGGGGGVGGILRTSMGASHI